MTRSLPKATRATLAAFTIALLSLQSVAWAQPQDNTQPAQAAFRRGVTELDAHSYQAALIAFDESYRLYPSPVAIYNIAIAHRELGHTTVAIETFERYLTEGGARLPPERVRAVGDTIQQLRAQLATVSLTVSPSAFTTTLDGRDAAAPNGALTLDPGDHVIVVNAAGHRPWREELHLAPGQHVQRRVTLEAERPVTHATRVVVIERPVVIAPGPHPRQPPPTRPITSRWWFWTGLGAVVIGATVASIVIANDYATSDPLVPGTLFDVQTIRAR